MKQLLIAILVATVAIPAASADDLFNEAERSNRAFWQQGERALWMPAKPDRSALIKVLLSEDEDGGEYESDLLQSHEADYRDRLCVGMETEVSLDNGSRADCLSDTHAIEVEFSEKWPEGLGQALSYSSSTGLKPGIFLVCRQGAENCLRHRLRLDEALAAWKLPVDVWPRMTGAVLYIAPYALDKAVSVHCRVGLSIIEMDCWWAEVRLDYGVVLMAGNDNSIAA